MNENRLIWDFRIAAYLFLAGVGAGSLVISGIMWFYLGQVMGPLVRTAAWLGLILVGCGTLLLLSDLGQPARFWRVFSNPRSSVMSVGSWIISVFMLLCFIYLLSNSVLVMILAAVFGLGTATYTGVLLGVIKGRPFWNTPLLPVLFLVSALSTGGAALNISAWIGGMDIEVIGVGVLDRSLVIVEILLLFFYLLIMKNSAVEAARSADSLLSGAYSGLFWGGIIVVGLLLPLLIGFLAPGIELFGSLLALAGGYILRYIVLKAGNRTLLPGEHLEAGLF